MKKLFACLSAAAISAASSAWAAETYGIESSISSGGIDLVGGGYAGDRLAGPATADLVSVTGIVTHAANLTAQNPFRISNPTANAKLTFNGSGLVGVVPLMVTGSASAITYFDGAYVHARFADRDRGRHAVLDAAGDAADGCRHGADFRHA